MFASRIPSLRKLSILLSFLLAAGSVCDAAQITSYLITTAVLGKTFEYHIGADNQPTTFDATGFAPGLTIDRVTGTIFGTPNISGDYKIHLVAVGSGVAEADLTLRVYLAIPPNDPPDAMMSGGSDQILMDNQRSRIYCGHVDGITILDTQTRSVVKTIADRTVVSMALSPDGKRLWFVSTFMNRRVAWVDLDNLDNIVEVPVSDSVYYVREGLDLRLYGSVLNGDVLQMDANTGAVQQRFRPSTDFRPYGPPLLELSPDRKTLYVGDSFYVGTSLSPHGSLSRYDVATATPTLLQRVEMSAPYFWGLTAAPDGESVYVVPGTFEGWGSWFPHGTLCLAAQDLTQLRGFLPYRGTGKPPTLSADGRLVLQSVVRGDGGANCTGFVEIFSASTFTLLKTLTLGSVTSLGGGASVAVSSAVADPDYSHIFVWGSTGNGIPIGVGLTGMFVYNTASPAAPATPAKSLLNLATRMVTERGDNALIGGFIVTGVGQKDVVVRALGPSLPISGRVADPILEVYDSAGNKVAQNDNWNSNRATLLATGLAPIDEHEAAFFCVLEPGAYTVVVRNVSDASGITLLEIYDLNAGSASRIANLSTRGQVFSGDNVMIGGVIIGGTVSTNLVVRAIGPSLRNKGISNALSDPTLDIHDGYGVLIAHNDDWQTSPERKFADFGLAPSDDKESAVFLAATPGNYTAIVRGGDGGTGVGLVEFYNLQ